MGQVDVEHYEVRDALVSFRLEVVLRHPHGVVAILVQSPGDGFGFWKDRGQVVVVENAIVDCCAAVADVGHIDVSSKQAVELGDHS